MKVFVMVVVMLVVGWMMLDGVVDGVVVNDNVRKSMLEEVMK